MDSAEKFERHKSTRWVKAAVPSYGDEWDDGSDYDSEASGSKHTSAPPLPDIAQYQEEITHTLEKLNSPEKKNDTINSNHTQNDIPISAPVVNAENVVRKQTQRKPPIEGLVLSIDRFKNRAFGSDSSEDEDDGNGSEFSYTGEADNLQTVKSHVSNILDSIDDPAPVQTSSPKKIDTEVQSPIISQHQQHIYYNQDENISISPGQSPALSQASSTFNPRKSMINPHGNPPQRNNRYSYQTTSEFSDTDSIQKEGELYVASPADLRKPLDLESMNGSENGKNPINNQSTTKDQSTSNAYLPKHSDNPLVLSIDSMHRKSFIADSDSSDEEDATHYHSQYMHYEDDAPAKDLDNEGDADGDDNSFLNAYDDENYDDVPELNVNGDKKSVEAPTFNVIQISDDEVEVEPPTLNNKHLSLAGHKRSGSQASDIDSLIEDLRSASVNDFGDDSGDDYSLPQVETGFDVSLPDFDESSEKSPVANTKPLLIAKSPEVNKVLQDNDSQASLPLSQTGLVHSKSNKRPPPDISEFDTNVTKTPDLGSGLIENKVSPRNNLVSVDYSNIAFAVSDYMDDDDYKSSPEKQLEMESPDRLNVRDSSLIEDDESFDLDLEKTNTSGSLSTGGYSIGNSVRSANNDSLPELPTIFSNSTALDRPGAFNNVSRRDSTMSTMTTTTLNFGSWQPNTSNFRDRFIDDNDNESQIGFDPSESGYQRFTHGNDTIPEDSGSGRSSISIPETIDAPIENTLDLPDSGTDDEKDSSGELSTTTTESVLKDQFLEPMKSGLFKESKSMNSRENVTSEPAAAANRRYSSLLASSPPPSSRATSNSSTFVTTASELSPKNDGSPVAKRSSVGSADTITSKVKTYPLFNWKSIMATSQSIDRIRLLKEASAKEAAYDPGLKSWLNASLKQTDESENTLNVGAIATQAYKNAPTSDIRRNHSSSIRSKVSSVRDKVVGESAFHSTLGKKIFRSGKKLMRSAD